jgi:hypothetical protein
LLGKMKKIDVVNRKFFKLNCLDDV